MTHSLKYLFAILFTLGQFGLYADESEFTASANKSTVGKNETFRVTFTLTGDGDHFTPPDFENFRVVGGPMKGSNYSNINGRVSQSTTWTYDLKPIKEGTYTIGKARVKNKNKNIYSNPLTIKVVKGSVKPKNPNSPEAKANAGTILEVTVNRRSAYVGQPVYVTYKVYSRFRYNIGIPSEPDFEGFLVADNTPENTRAKIEVKDGKEYYAEVLKEFALFPQKSGKYTFDPISAEMVSEIPQRDSWGFPSARNVRHYPEARFPSIEVKPLPPGAPEDFKGAVGSFEFDLNLSRLQTNADESVTISLNLEGRGNLKFVELPDFELPSSLETYEPKNAERMSLGRNGYKGYKKQEYLLIPRYRGTFRIPPVSFSYFDPVENEYRTLLSKEYELEVISGSDAPERGGPTGIRGRNQQEIEVLNEDILFIKTGDVEFQKETKPFAGSTFFWVLLGMGMAGITLPWILFPVTTKVVRKNKQLNEGKIFRKFYSEIKKGKALAKDEKMNESYEVLEHALEDFLSKWLNIPRSAMNRETIGSALSRSGFEELTEELDQLFQKCNAARYSPVSSSAAERDLDEAQQLVRKIQK